MPNTLRKPAVSNRSSQRSSLKTKRLSVGTPPRKRRLQSVPEASTSARETLLRAAKHLFAHKGLSGTTIRDIAQEAKMNSSQISYYFENKEGLYRACVQNIAEGRLSIAEQILVLPTSKQEYEVRLRLFIDNIFSYFLEDRDTGLIIIREFDRIHSPAEKVFKTYFWSLFELLVDFFEEAQKKGYIKKGEDGLTLTSLFFGMLISELRFDHLKESLFQRSLKNTSERKKVTDQIIALFS